MLRFICVCVAALVGVHLHAAPVLPAPAQYPSFSVATGVLLLPDVLIMDQGAAWGHVRAELHSTDLAAFALTRVEVLSAPVAGVGGVYDSATRTLSLPLVHVQLADSVRSFEAALRLEEQPQRHFILSAARPLPYFPGLSGVSVTGTSLSLHWQPAAGTAAFSYQVHVAATPAFTPGADTLQATVTETQYEITGLAPLTAYHALIVAVDANGTSSRERDYQSADTQAAQDFQIFHDRLADTGDGPDMVMLPGGDFMMGDVSRNGYSNERPAHWVTLPRFAIGRYEVTNAEYARFLNAVGTAGPDWLDSQDVDADSRIIATGTGYQVEPGYEQQPMAEVSWYGARAYAAWLSAQSGQHYRLPTEAEWEYAARGGTLTDYWWGTDFPAVGINQANCHDYLTHDDWWGLAPVGSFAPNPFGLHDVVGNLTELVQDRYSADYFRISPRLNPQGPDSGDFYVARGGNWYNYTAECRPGFRTDVPPDGNSAILGFRLARVP